jgi:hypothetical protein
VIPEGGQASGKRGHRRAATAATSRHAKPCSQALPPERPWMPSAGPRPRRSARPWTACRQALDPCDLSASRSFPFLTENCQPGPPLKRVDYRGKKTQSSPPESEWCTPGLRRRQGLPQPPWRVASTQVCGGSQCVPAFVNVCFLSLSGLCVPSLQPAMHRPPRASLSAPVPRRATYLSASGAAPAPEPACSPWSLCLALISWFWLEGSG